MKHVLIVSPYFPPATLAGVHRARHLGKHLANFGWKPVIIRVDESHYAEPLDIALGNLVPDHVTQVRTAAIPYKLTRSIGFGDLGLRGYFPIKDALESAIQEWRPEVILITGSPYYPFLLSGWIKRRFKIPVVLDNQDPWVSAEGALWPLFSKRGLSHKLATILEPIAVRDASFITSVSERQNEELAELYPWLNRHAMAAIPIGGDPDDFEALKAQPPSNPKVVLEPNRVHLSYVGTFLPRASVVVEKIFRALKLLKDEAPELANRLVLNFVGTSNQPAGGGTHLVTPIAQDYGVEEMVREVPERVPFLEALNILVNSDGLMLLGSDEPHYTASKIYPALMSGTPFISIFHRASSAHQILLTSGGGFPHAFETLEELNGITPKLKQQLTKFAEGTVKLAPPDPRAYEPFHALNVAKQFAEVFDGLTK